MGAFPHSCFDSKSVMPKEQGLFPPVGGCRMAKKKASVEAHPDGGLALVGALSRRENSLLRGGYMRAPVSLPAVLVFIGANRAFFAVADHG